MKKSLYQRWMIRLQMFLAAPKAAPATGRFPRKTRRG